jgi:hypothetical protein
MDPEKRKLRQTKRAVKRAGNRHRRQQLKRDLARNPEGAAFSEEDVGRDRSADLNGLDNDSTRRKKGGEERG